MASSIANIENDFFFQKKVFLVFGVLLLSSLFLSIATQQYYIAALPAGVLLGFLTIVDFRKIFYLLIICIPLSTEYVFPNGFGLDLPTEPLMLILMGIFFLFSIRHGKELKSDYIKHPLSLLLLLHVAWIFITAITSEQVSVSIKFFLAKLWYVAVFYFMAGRILKSEKDIRSFFWCLFIPLILTILIVLVKHAGYGFSFKDVYKTLSPFYRNHVAYASIMALFLPFVWYARSWYKTRSWQWWLLLASIPFLLIAIQLSYTRAAQVTTFAAIAYYFIIKFRLTKVVILTTIISVILGLSFLAHKNTYLNFAPNYEKTISHTKFDNLLEATYKLEDISTMERLYRWVAASQMIQEHPLMGFGPGNFYFFYKSYTLSIFRTYVSNNPEKSGIHSYYLMTLIEQGIVGLLFFILFSFYTLIKGEHIYHQTKNIERKNLVLMALLCIVVIDLLLVINDLIETDKIGPFYFICLAILVNVDLANQKEIKNITI